MSERDKKSVKRLVYAVVAALVVMGARELKGETAFENVPVVTRAGSEAFPAIWGNYIVWKMAENEAYDVGQAKIVEMPGLVITGVPDIWANKVVWSDANGYYDMDLQQMMYPEGLSVGEWPALHANKIVWSDSNGYYDLELGEMVCPPGLSIGNRPDIFEDKIVWDKSTGYYDIGLERMVFPEGAAIGYGAAIYGNKVVWNHLGGYYDIELQEYVGGAGGWIDMGPDIFEDAIVFTNYDAAPPIVIDVRVWDPICAVRGVTDSGCATFPRVYNSTIVWMDKRNGNADIYMARMAGCCGDPEHPYPEGDLNHDCRVNMVDLTILASHWLECTAPECASHEQPSPPPRR